MLCNPGQLTEMHGHLTQKEKKKRLKMQLSVKEHGVDIVGGQRAIDNISRT